MTTKTKDSTRRHVIGDLYVANKRLVRTAKSFKAANANQRPATHILSDETPSETICGYRDFVVVGGTSAETHLCGRCRVKFIKEG